ncbi:MAG: hypothetical protein ACK5Q5_09400 [Planctomycetaceae bacterium]
MTTDTPELTTLDELRSFVHETLCAKENLLLSESRLHELALRKGESVCGVQFFVHGPRLVRLSAVWSADHNTLYCYDTNGERYLKLQLTHPIPFSAN